LATVKHSGSSFLACDLVASACEHHSTAKVKVKRSHYRPGVAQRVGRGIALLFHDRGTRR